MSCRFKTFHKYWRILLEHISFYRTVTIYHGSPNQEKNFPEVMNPIWYRICTQRKEAKRTKQETETVVGSILRHILEKASSRNSPGAQFISRPVIIILSTSPQQNPILLYSRTMVDAKEHKCKINCTNIWVVLSKTNNRFKWASNLSNFKSFMRSSDKSLFLTEKQKSHILQLVNTAEEFQIYREYWIKQYLKLQCMNLVQRGKTEIENLSTHSSLSRCFERKRRHFLWDNNSCSIDAVTSIFPFVIHILMVNGYFEKVEHAFVSPAGTVLALHHFPDHATSIPCQKHVSNYAREVVLDLARECYGNMNLNFCWSPNAGQKFISLVDVVIHDIFLPLFGRGGSVFGGKSNVGLVDNYVHLITLEQFVDQLFSVDILLRNLFNGKKSHRKGIHILTFNLPEKFNMDWKSFFETDWDIYDNGYRMRLVSGLSYNNKHKNHFVSCFFQVSANREKQFYHQDSIQKRFEFQKVSIAEAAENSDHERKPKAFLYKKCI